ncbi:MAG TPA: sensor histidine kinase [Methylophaga sp.]|jgi:two-component system sensor histidine kinase KdpD|nr:sensor histidine kinase [Methylophaga sp.]MAP26969.1 sensor histidine kinase [Methylophaga sp.]MBP26290.1 sensor histidine kinase [Methylophaga sp.]HCC79774.1 sensor histidine kinase [Methylophaga sp.]HCN99345.1 sensor histidine kinase [Methylophaga sp.]|tara:strand:- start:3687 stop:5237 length:1551 start_codon:yes stop_codon:yes gene_type:complete
MRFIVKTTLRIFQKKRSAMRFLPTNTPLKHYLLAIGLIFVIVLFAQVLNRYLPYTSLLLLFLAGVLLISAKTSFGPALLSSLFSFMAFNYFFTEPYYTFNILHKADVATLIIFLMVALMTAHLATQMREAIAKQEMALNRLSHFYEFSQKLSFATNTETTIEILLEALRRVLSNDGRVVIAIQQESKLILHPEGISSGHPGEEVFKLMLSKHLDGETWHKGWLFFPLSWDGRQLGLVAINERINDKQITATETFCQLTAVVLHRTMLVAELSQTKLLAETEQLRATLLSSVSHDLRTPLSSIIGASSSLREYAQHLSTDDQQLLIQTIEDEAHRLDRHIQNLLDMTRLSQGKLNLNREWMDIDDLINGAIRRLGHQLDNVQFELELTEDTPMLYVQGLIIEQAIFNLLDNAIRHNTAELAIKLIVQHDDNWITLDIIDNGPGIADTEKEKVFNMFYSLAQGDRHESSLPGTGMGLAICRGMVEAHGGEVMALDNPYGKGTMMRIKLPNNQGAVDLS